MDAFGRLKKHLKGPPRVAQKAFAGKVGVAQSVISLMANEKRAAPLEAIPALNRLLGTTFDDWAKAEAAVKRGRRAEAASKAAAKRKVA
jgi:plasmid maintenance system antidote protein VapI